MSTSGLLAVDFDGKLTVASAEAKTLSQVRLSDVGLRNIRVLSQLKALTDLNLSFNAISNLTPLTGLTALTSVDVSHNKLSSLNGLAGSAASLHVLRCSHNGISDLMALNQCQKLEELWLQHNSVGLLQDLHHLTNVATLKKLVFFPNPCAKKRSAAYRLEVVRLLPQLESLDAQVSSHHTDQSRLGAC